MNLNRDKQILLFLIKDPNKKSWIVIIREFIMLLFSKKELPKYYITNLLYRKNVDNYKKYLSFKENRKLLIWSQSQAKAQINLVQNKLLFGEFLIKNNIPTPKIYCHNSKTEFTYNNDVFQINSKKDLLVFFENIFIAENISHILCKPIDSGLGKNIFILDKLNLCDLDDNLIHLFISNSFIFQELILQHEVLKKINDTSLNTLRIVTYKTKSNNVEILSGFIRIGRKGAIVDNAHAGGIVIALNKETGEIRSEGLQLIDNGGGIFYKHPDSGVVFEGIQIPHYQQVKQIVTKATKLLNFPLLGWDVAIHPDGPVIIETNHNFHLMLSDRMENVLKNNVVFNELLKQIENKN